MHIQYILKVSEPKVHLCAGNCLTLNAFLILIKGARTHAIVCDRAQNGLSVIAQSVFCALHVKKQSLTHVRN